MIIEMTKEVVTTLNVQISIEPAKKCLVSAISENEKKKTVSTFLSQQWSLDQNLAHSSKSLSGIKLIFKFTAVTVIKCYAYI